MSTTTAATYETVIGLEVHAQLADARPRCSAAAGRSSAPPPNTQTCPVCQGMPGSLPVINRRAVEFGIMTALALGCGINAHNRFARKHYFYPDMPKNYQISQYEEPLAEHGALEVDAGRARGGSASSACTSRRTSASCSTRARSRPRSRASVDFNRAGVPLMEIVTKPDLRSPDEAAAYLRALRAILVYLGVCDGNMEEGSLRCDANVSLRPRGRRSSAPRSRSRT